MRGKSDQDDEPLLPKHGGYRHLKSFQVAQLVHDVTQRFCDRYINSRSRTHDQMVQAARSGVQNIAEGSVASGTSKKTELKLTNVARASLEELRVDYEDFLRQRGLREWDRHDPRRKALISRRCRTADDVARWIVEIRDGREKNGRDGRDGRDGHDGHDGQIQPSTPSISSTSSIRSINAELSANAALVLIGVATSLLTRQIASLARTFENQGGFTERMYRIRKNRRG